MVSRVAVEDVLEVYVVRENLEGLAASLAARHRSQQQLDRLEDILSRMARATSERSPADLADLNLSFHKVIRKAAANHYLDHLLTRVEFAVRRFGRTTFEVPGRAEEAVEEHRRIVEALRAGDAQAAERLATEHKRRARTAYSDVDGPVARFTGELSLLHVLDLSCGNPLPRTSPSRPKTSAFSFVLCCPFAEEVDRKRLRY
jgi:DNA-binding GntR family transcriptional regulator